MTSSFHYAQSHQFKNLVCTNDKMNPHLKITISEKILNNKTTFQAEVKEGSKVVFKIQKANWSGMFVDVSYMDAQNKLVRPGYRPYCNQAW